MDTKAVFFVGLHRAYTADDIAQTEYVSYTVTVDNVKRIVKVIIDNGLRDVEGSIRLTLKSFLEAKRLTNFKGGAIYDQSVRCDSNVVRQMWANVISKEAWASAESQTDNKFAPVWGNFLEDLNHLPKLMNIQISFIGQRMICKPHDMEPICS